MAEGLPRGRAVDLRGLVERGVEVVEVALDRPDVERERREVDEDQRPVAVEPEDRGHLPEAVEDREHRHQRERGREQLHDEEGVQQRRPAPEADPAERVARYRRERHDPDRGDDPELDRVPHPQQHREGRRDDRAVGARVVEPEGEDPVLERRVLGQEPPGREVPLPEGDRHDHQEREQDQREERDHERVRRDLLLPEGPGMLDDHAAPWKRLAAARLSATKFA